MKTLCVLIATLTLAWLGLEVENKIHYRLSRDKPMFFSASPSTVLSTAPAKPKPVFDAFMPVAPPADHPPLHFMAGGDLWTIAYPPQEYFEKRDCGAFSRFDDRVVGLNRSRGSVQNRVDLVHELMHIALRNRGGKMSRIEHPSQFGGWSEESDEWITPIANGFGLILQDNPGLSKWIFKLPGIAE